MSGEERAAKRPKRTYRACYPCRSRKLKCSFGDPNMPWDGPCERCMREQRECVRAQATFVRDAIPRRSDVVDPTPSRSGSGLGPAAGPSRHGVGREWRPLEGRGGSRSGSRSPPYRDRPLNAGHPHAHAPHVRRPRTSHSSPRPRSRSPHSRSSDDEGGDGNTLVSSNLQTPSDALKLLASASSLRYREAWRRPSAPGKGDKPRHGKDREAGGVGQDREATASGSRTPAQLPQGNNAATWFQWSPIQQGCLTVQDARALLSFFELEMAPLYPLIHPVVFEPQYLETLVKQESLLLGSIIVIAARYSNILAENRGQVVHHKLAQWVRLRILGVFDGDPALRSISTIEALLLLAEWPMLPMPTLPDHDATSDASEEALLLRPSLRYDAYAWTNLGLAVRLAQELGLHDVSYLMDRNHDENPWKQNRMLKTWVYCFNADRHIAVRLGRNAVFQEAMTSRWWEAISSLVVDENRRPGGNDVWTSEKFILGANAQLLGTIQNHLYPNKEVTRALLRTGAWESFLRSLSLEIRYSKHGHQEKLGDGTVDSALLRIELDYVVLYAYSLALRSLQGKLRRRRQANDAHYRAPSLLNMCEGPWIMEALSAARSIIDITLNDLEGRGVLRYCPSRISQYILFATTFLYKALAAGMVEHGESNMAGMLDAVVTALSNAAIDDQHFLRGFADLLKRLGKHWRTSKASPSTSMLIPPSLRPDNVSDASPSAAAKTPQADAAVSGPPPHATRTAAPNEGFAMGELTLQGLGFPRVDSASPHDAPLGTSHAQLQQPQDSFHHQAHTHSQPTSNPNTIPDGGTPSSAAAAAAVGDLLPPDFGWNFDPTFQMPAADHEQDMLFQSIWDSTQQDIGIGSTSNLYATLLGDTLAFPEGLEAL